MEIMIFFLDCQSSGTGILVGDLVFSQVSAQTLPGTAAVFRSQRFRITAISLLKFLFMFLMLLLKVAET